ncbi:hypothetical protein SLEP1_g5919 [Rubroshorea leprosula]|uniref:Uncharacterized protein n=1 Tax=Rubroshorea leprosula TaxID=152421 RepID=A0AAV5HTH3_9ROSI|nr:hypothetical protein SLEP1_g5919 [Rubroshorea leprosula]
MSQPWKYQRNQIPNPIPSTGTSPSSKTTISRSGAARSTTSSLSSPSSSPFPSSSSTGGVSVVAVQTPPPPTPTRPPLRPHNHEGSIPLLSARCPSRWSPMGSSQKPIVPYVSVYLAMATKLRFCLNVNTFTIPNASTSGSVTSRVAHFVDLPYKLTHIFILLLGS